MTRCDVRLESVADDKELQWFLSGLSEDAVWFVLSYGGGCPPGGTFEEHLMIAPPIEPYPASENSPETARYYWRDVANNLGVDLLRTEDVTRDDFPYVGSNPLENLNEHGLMLTQEGCVAPDQWQVIKRIVRANPSDPVYTVEIAWHAVLHGQKEWQAAFGRQKIRDLDEADLPLMFWSADRDWLVSTQWDSPMTMLYTTREVAQAIRCEPALEVL